MSDAAGYGEATSTIGKSSYLRGRIGWQGLRASEFVDQGPYLVTGTDFVDGRVDWRRCYHVSDARFHEARYIQVRDGDLLITKDGTIGKVAYVTDCPEKVVLNSGVFLLRCSDGSYEHRFLYHLLNSRIFDDFLRLNMAGSTISHLYQYVFERFRFPTPSKPIQAFVADTLDQLDEAIRNTERLIAKAQHVKAGLMHELFARGVLPDGNLRPTRLEAPELYKESVVGIVPREWDVDRLVSRRRRNRAHLKTGPFGSSLKLEHWVEIGHPVITIGSLGEGEFIQSELLFVGPGTLRRMREYQLEPGDIVFSRVADVGRSAVIREEHGGWIMSGNMMRISLDPEQVLPDYLQAQLTYDQVVRRQIRRSVNAGGREVANSAILNGLWFAWPCPDEQFRAMRRVAGVQAILRRERAHADKLRQMKQGLMRDLLTGTVRMPTKFSQVEMATAGV
jgi:type I restriction enzyme, S subunit